MCIKLNILYLPPPNRRTYSYSEPQLYSQNSGGSYFDTQGGSSQVSTVVTSHGMTNNGGGGGGGMTMNLTGGQVISSSPGAYIMDNAAPHPATQTARASPATVSAQPPTPPPHRRNGADHLHPPACFCVLPPFRLVPRLSSDLRPQPPGVVSIDATFLVPSSPTIFECARVLVHTFADFIGTFVTPVFSRILQNIQPSSER